MLKQIAEKKYSTSAQISLAWLMSKSIVPIPGTRKLIKLEENTGAVYIVLTPKEISDIDNALSNIEISEVFGRHRQKP